MDPVKNPFSPGAGAPPPELAGREELRRTVEIAIQRVKEGRPAKSALMIGLRGVGKTVLLNEMANLADDPKYQDTVAEMKRLLAKLPH